MAQAGDTPDWVSKVRVFDAPATLYNSGGSQPLPVSPLLNVAGYNTIDIWATSDTGNAPSMVWVKVAWYAGAQLIGFDEYQVFSTPTGGLGGNEVLASLPIKGDGVVVSTYNPILSRHATLVVVGSLRTVPAPSLQSDLNGHGVSQIIVPGVAFGAGATNFYYGGPVTKAVSGQLTTTAAGTTLYLQAYADISDPTTLYTVYQVSPAGAGTVIIPTVAIPRVGVVARIGCVNAATVTLVLMDAS